MGIYGFFKQIRPAIFFKISQNPQFLKLITHAELYWREKPLPGENRLRGLDNLTGQAKEYYDSKLQTRALLKAEYNYDYLSEPALELDNDWQTIEFIIKTASDPNTKVLGELIYNSQEIGGVEIWSYGAPIYLTPEQVTQASKLLNDINTEKIVYSIEFTDYKRAKLYAFQDSWTQEDMLFFAEIINAIRGYFADAAQKGNYIFYYLT
jgi:hypothetical protein